MGWTTQDLGRYGTNLDYAKAEHVRNATSYGDGIHAEMLACEWKPKTFFAIIRLSGGEYEKPVTFLRVDLIEQSATKFGYKDGCEEMGMYCEDKPSKAFAALVYKLIPQVQGYAQEFRDRMGIKYDLPQMFPATEVQLELV